jgi:hypothetical protein
VLEHQGATVVTGIGVRNLVWGREGWKILVGED